MLHDCVEGSKFAAPDTAPALVQDAGDYHDEHPLRTVIAKEYLITVFNGLKPHANSLIRDVSGLVEATDHLVGKSLRREIFNAITLEERITARQDVQERWQPILIEKKPYYLKKELDESEGIAELVDGEKVILRLIPGSRIDYRDYLHELGHGIYCRMDSGIMLDFTRLYQGMFSEFTDLVRKGANPVNAANKLATYQFFLDVIDPAEDGLICWDGFVGQEYELANIDRQRYFNRKDVPKIDVAYRLRFDPEEAFCEFFSYYFKLRKSPKPFRFEQDGKFARKKALYEFGNTHMKDILQSARPYARRQRKLL